MVAPFTDYTISNSISQMLIVFHKNLGQSRKYINEYDNFGL